MSQLIKIAEDFKLELLANHAAVVEPPIALLDDDDFVLWLYAKFKKEHKDGLVQELATVCSRIDSWRGYAIEYLKWKNEQE